MTAQDLSMREVEEPLSSVDFLAKYFSMTSLLAARDSAINRGEDQAATIFAKAADRRTWVGAKPL